MEGGRKWVRGERRGLGCAAPVGLRKFSTRAPSASAAEAQPAPAHPGPRDGDSAGAASRTPGGVAEGRRGGPGRGRRGEEKREVMGEAGESRREETSGAEARGFISAPPMSPWSSSNSWEAAKCMPAKLAPGAPSLRLRPGKPRLL